MTTTPRGAPELVSAQAVPETTVNEQIRRTEAGAGRYPVADRVTAPPGTCADGATYLIIATATGAFLGKENQLATAVGTNAASGWYYRTLGTIDEGVLAYVQDEDTEYKWSGSAWAAVSVSSYTDENARDAIGATLVAGSGVTITVNDGADTITIAASGGGGGGNLDGLSDVVISSPVTGQVLKYNGTSWVNDTDATGSAQFAYPVSSFAPGDAVTFNANYVGLRPLIVPVNMTITGIRFYATTAAGTAVVEPVLYSATSGGVPNSKIANATATTGVTAGLNTLPFSTPYAATAGTLIFLGLSVTTASISVASAASVPAAYWTPTTNPAATTAPSATQTSTAWASFWIYGTA